MEQKQNLPETIIPEGYSLLYTEDQILQRIQEIASEIIARYKDKSLLFIVLLRGGVQYSTELLTEITRQDPSFHPDSVYMTIRTYDGEEAKQPELIQDVTYHNEIEGRNIALIDDVLDLGVTASFARDHVLSLGAASVMLTTLTQKHNPERKLYPSSEIYGFETPNRWLQGWGMNGPNEENRYLRTILIKNVQIEPVAE